MPNEIHGDPFFQASRMRPSRRRPADPPSVAASSAGFNSPVINDGAVDSSTIVDLLELLFRLFAVRVRIFIECLAGWGVGRNERTAMRAPIVSRSTPMPIAVCWAVGFVVGRAKFSKKEADDFAE
jgi:hypothetical protein